MCPCLTCRVNALLQLDVDRFIDDVSNPYLFLSASVSTHVKELFVRWLLQRGKSPKVLNVQPGHSIMIAMIAIKWWLQLLLRNPKTANIILTSLYQVLDISTLQLCRTQGWTRLGSQSQHDNLQQNMCKVYNAIREGSGMEGARWNVSMELRMKNMKLTGDDCHECSRTHLTDWTGCGKFAVGFVFQHTRQRSKGARLRLCCASSRVENGASCKIEWGDLYHSTITSIVELFCSVISTVCPEIPRTGESMLCWCVIIVSYRVPADALPAHQIWGID